jgi:hypothetical protein
MVEEAKPKAATANAGVVCGACGTQNAPGMNFCKMCGSSLAAPAPAPVAAAEAPGKVNCSSCGKQTPTGFAFCQHCGQRLAAASAVASGTAIPVVAPSPMGPKTDSRAVAATMMSEAPHIATPPAGMPRSSANVPAQPATSAPRASAPAPVHDAYAQTVGPGAIAPIVASTLPGDLGSRAASAPMTTVKTNPVPAIVFGTLIVVRRDGTDGESVPITEPVFDVGRSLGGLTFSEDVYLAARHMRLSFEGTSPVVRALDDTNGIFVRLRGAVDLSSGDQFLVGKELIRFELVGPEERDPQVVEHGVRLFGSVGREAWGRLRQITGAGTTRDVWYISRPDLVLGREEGDVTVPDDEFMSRRHAAVRRATPKPKLEDLTSSNGTFIRVRGDHVLRQGDLLRLGDQLLRVEL